MSSKTPKEKMVRSLAAIQGIGLPAICAKCKVHKTFFYRVVRGQGTSARVDTIIARELGIKLEALRRCR